MSREFGDYGGGGYFHDKVRSALEDLQNEAREDFHKEFTPLFESLYEIAYAISSVEACDSCLDRTITTTMEELPKIKKVINQIEEKIRPYQDVAQTAVRRYIEEQRK